MRRPREIERGRLCIAGEELAAGETKNAKTDPPTQGELVKRKDFYPTPYVGQHGWVSTDGNEGDIDWDVVQMIVAATYRRVAPKRLVAQLDDQP